MLMRLLIESHKRGEAAETATSLMIIVTTVRQMRITALRAT